METERDALTSVAEWSLLVWSLPEEWDGGKSTVYQQFYVHIIPRRGHDARAADQIDTLGVGVTARNETEKTKRGSLGWRWV